MNVHNAVMGLVGGALIGVSASILFATVGKIAGVSGILAGSVSGPQRHWRRLFIGGLVIGGLLSGPFVPLAFTEYPTNNVWTLLGGGLLVGYGTRLGNGCTSGHGVCGLSRLSQRSVVATFTFMTMAFLTVYVMQHHVMGAP